MAMGASGKIWSEENTVWWEEEMLMKKHGEDGLVRVAACEE